MSKGAERGSLYLSETVIISKNIYSSVHILESRASYFPDGTEGDWG